VQGTAGDEEVAHVIEWSRAQRSIPGHARMRAATVAAPNVVEVRDFDVPAATEPGQLVVRMLRASVCGSDVHSAFHGFHAEGRLGAPGYPGHEGVGEVVESRSTRFAEGDLVLTVPVPDFAGCFAEYQLIDEGQVVPVGADADIDRVLLAQQYGTTLYSMRLFWPQAGNTGIDNGVAAVIGAGSAGLFFLQQARQLGFERVVVSDLDADRLAVARSLGAAEIVDATSASIVDAVDDLTGGKGADLVIEAAGYDSCRVDAIAAVRSHGTVGCFGFPEGYGLAPFPANTAFRKVVRIQWASGTQNEPGLVAFHDAVRHIREGSIEVDYCLGTNYTLEEVPEALERATALGRGAVKMTIDIAGR